MSNDSNITNGVMLNAYPDSIGNNLSDLVAVLKKPEFKDVFSLFYVLPTFFNSDLDRGFSIIDYNINEDLVSKSDLEDLEALNIQLKFDIVLNHLSVASPQFKDLLEKGETSKYKDFFINWNTFWEGHGDLNDDGVIIPEKEYLEKLFMRKSGLPILKVPFPDGTEQPYWNTFYQKVNEDLSILGQMDVNAKSELVWEFYEETLAQLKEFGCKILRLDAFAYLHKEIGQSNFFNKPGTWEYLERIKHIADRYNLKLLPEIHAEYGSYLHDEVANEGYQIYDFFLPGLMIHAIEKKDSKALITWAKEIIQKGYKTVNMLGCHDGIPVLDLKGKQVNDVFNKGLLEDEDIEDIMNTVLERGGRVKNLYDASGKKISYYQVNATFFSALGEDEQKLLLARAIQLFMPGIPQIWYLDIFAGKNDYEAVDKAGSGGHKEINRTTLSMQDIEEGLSKNIVLNQLKLLKLRNTSKAFSGSVRFNETSNKIVDIKWVNKNEFAHLKANLDTYSFIINYSEAGETKFYSF
ncbi:sucrose phosphorylase [Seonamhaeicola sediminis]|uniref:Sucrose phosphorylase n=1 Tax=Seonamhaeicola sediminis TaxID=2528206 RepID=A0A562YGV6_9FLAO|nr:sucrose phosphorylase [Seonamhaeicola sediminis]TWO33788.1 sucrose phosphorylase [Seonamhaeicola sediminis]